MESLVSRVSGTRIFAAVCVLALIGVSPAHGFDVGALAKKAWNSVRGFDAGTLAKKARAAVGFIQVYDKDGNKIATGSGFFVSPDGLLITNCHVIQEASSATVKTGNIMLMIKGAVAFDQGNDLALLAVEGGSNLPSLVLGNSENVQAGDHVAVIGSPLGLEDSLSEGIVSAKRGDGNRRLLQITAPISPGSSGSPVLDSTGKVIGIATAEMREGQSVNFAVPAELAAQLLRAQKPTGALIPLSQVAYGYALERGGDYAAAELEVLNSPGYAAVKDALFQARYSVTMHQQADWGTLLNNARALIAQYPNSGSANEMLGQIYEETGFLDEAVEAYQRAVKLDADNTGAWASLGSIYKEKGKMAQADFAFSQAIAYQQKRIEHSPLGIKKALALEHLSLIYSRAGNEDAAKQAHLQSIQERERSKR